MSMAAAEQTAAPRPGAAGPKLSRTEASAGPAMKPRPNAAPIIPMPRARPSGSVRIGDHRLGRGDVAAGGAGQQPRGEEQDQGVGRGQQQVAAHRARQGEHQHRAPAERSESLPSSGEKRNCEAE